MNGIQMKTPSPYIFKMFESLKEKEKSRLNHSTSILEK